jgi:hypothetical protein
MPPRKMNEARRKGHGLRVKDWEVESTDTDEVGGLVDSILAWARHTLAGCRRPYGIDHFDLALAFRSEADRKVRSVAFDRLRPIDLYQEWFPERLASSITNEVGGPAASALCVSAALFSWGEAAHYALPNRAS